MIQVLEVKTEKDIKEFIDFPFKIYKGDKNWVPPLKNDEKKMFSPHTNPELEFCDTQFWLAKDNGKTVGRIITMINHKYNEKVNKAYARFFKFESINVEVGEQLLLFAENWAREKRSTHIHGPLGFSNLGNQGLLIEGFEYLPSIASTYNKVFYKDIFDKLEYQKENDWIEFILYPEDCIDERILKLNETIKKRYNLIVNSFKKRKELQPFIPQVLEVLNQAFAELPYVIPFDEKTGSYYIEKYFSLLNPNLIKIITNKDGEAVAFIVGLPSLSRAMQKANGKLSPWGIYNIFRAINHPKVVDLALTAVLPQLQRQGVAAVLITELQKELIRYGVKEVETTGIFETNTQAVQTWKNFKHIQHKRRRCYVKEL
jgi:GNAT superfamily N-acetyltransferase